MPVFITFVASFSMKFSSLFRIAGGLALAAISLTSCKDDVPAPGAPTGEFTLHMDNGVSNAGPTGTGFASLVLNSASYKNAHGDDFTVNSFRYYISNVKLLKADNSSYAVPDSYFLVDHAVPASLDLNMKNVPVGDYTAVSFVVGVDSARTKAGNFTGVLNPNNNMYWDMNGPEFKNVVLEGTSPQNTRSGALVFHIAGYKHSTTNTIRTVTLPFPPSMLLVRTDHSPEAHLHVDILKMFTGTTTVNFATTNNVMGGIPAAQIADNIAAGMFSVSHVHAN